MVQMHTLASLESSVNANVFSKGITLTSDAIEVQAPVMKLGVSHAKHDPRPLAL